MQILFEFSVLCLLISSSRTWDYDDKEFYRPRRGKSNDKIKNSPKKSKNDDLLNELAKLLPDDFPKDHQKVVDKEHIWPESFSGESKMQKLPPVMKNHENEKKKNNGQDYEGDESELELQRLLGFVEEHKDRSAPFYRKSREKHSEKALMNRDGRRCRKKPKKWGKNSKDDSNGQRVFEVEMDFDDGHSLKRFPKGFESFILDDNDGSPQQFIVEGDIENDQKTHKYGGEIVIPQKKNSSDLLSSLGNFLKESFNVGYSSTPTISYRRTTISQRDNDDFEEETTTTIIPVELILPLSGSRLVETLTEEIPTTDGSDEISNIPDDRVKVFEEMSPGSAIIGTRHETYDFEIKEIPIYKPKEKPIC